MANLSELVQRAQTGDVDAFGDVVAATQRMVYAVACRILRNAAEADDATQQTFLQAFRRLHDLRDPEAFPGWLRRIAVTNAINQRQRSRTTFLRLDDTPEIPILDDEERNWSELQRRALAVALLTLTPEERQICDRRYHGHWSTARLAAVARVDDAAMRKRLERIRGKLRREIEMAEQREVSGNEMRADMPERIIELLARPRLTDIPENPVGLIQELLRRSFADFVETVVPETVDLAAASAIAADAVYVAPSELHRIDDRRILRYDLTLPLLLNVRFRGEPLRIWTSGKTYRVCREDSMHLQAFHQAEAFWLDDRSALDPWRMAARVLQSLNAVLQNRQFKIVPTQYPMCSEARELEVEQEGQWLEVLAWGVFSDKVMAHVGADPASTIAIGVGYGLERLAMLRYGIDDIRKVDVATIPPRALAATEGAAASRPVLMFVPDRRH